MNLALSHLHQPHVAQSTRESSRPAKRAAHQQQASVAQARSRRSYVSQAPVAFSIAALTRRQPKLE